MTIYEHKQANSRLFLFIWFIFSIQSSYQWRRHYWLAAMFYLLWCRFTGFFTCEEFNPSCWFLAIFLYSFEIFLSKKTRLIFFYSIFIGCWIVDIFHFHRLLKCLHFSFSSVVELLTFFIFIFFETHFFSTRSAKGHKVLKAINYFL